MEGLCEGLSDRRPRTFSKNLRLDFARPRSAVVHNPGELEMYPRPKDLRKENKQKGIGESPIPKSPASLRN
jgi:hypothetical protein